VRRSRSAGRALEAAFESVWRGSRQNGAQNRGRGRHRVGRMHANMGILVMNATTYKYCAITWVSGRCRSVNMSSSPDWLQHFYTIIGFRLTIHCRARWRRTEHLSFRFGPHACARRSARYIIYWLLLRISSVNESILYQNDFWHVPNSLWQEKSMKVHLVILPNDTYSITKFFISLCFERIWATLVLCIHHF
jgi:hypothetical protein